MKRRQFLTTTLAASAAVTTGSISLEKERQYYEFIHYQVVNSSKMGKLENYWETAALPAFNNLGITPIGVFRSKYGSHGLDLYVLIPHKNLESFVTSWDKIKQDAAYQKAGEKYIKTDKKDPLYYRYDTSLLHAFTHMPELEIPANIQNKKSRLFEVRIYESHNREKAKLKIEMFNKGGEIALFRKTGLHPVMFAETLAGNKMPNLTYILGFENMEEHDRNWDNFRNSESWQKMKNIKRYKDTVSSVTDIILRPVSCSQM
jgi:hypothetical protein